MNENPSDDQIGALLQEAASTFRAPVGLRESVRAELTPDAARPHRPGRGRRLRLITAALATVSGIAAVIAVLLWPASISMAEVVAALDEAEWVRIRYDTGREIWISVPRGIRASKQATGHHVYSDYDRGLRWRWSFHMFPNSAGPKVIEDTQIIEETIERRRLNGTIWEQTVGHLEKHAKTPARKRGEWWVERAGETVAGRDLVRFDTWIDDGAGRRLLIKQLWADPETRLPVKVREKLQLADREALGGVEHENGVFDFPDTGPKSIYGLGVRREIPIVRRDESGPSPAADEIMEAARAARDRFPEHFRQLCWGESRGRGGEVDRMWFSGHPEWRTFGNDQIAAFYDTVRVRLERYFQGDEPMEFPATAGQVETWLERQEPISLHVSDGDRTISRNGPFTNMPLTARIMKVGRRTGFNSSSWITNRQWPLYERWLTAYDVIDRADHAPDAPPNTIGLRHVLGDLRSDYYIDPVLDFICVTWRQEKLVDGQWKLDLGNRLTDFVQLPGGQWVATRSHILHTRGVVRNFHVTVLDETDVPAALFDIDRLLEEARRDGAVIESH